MAGRTVVGISALSHDAAACLLDDGQLDVAAEEERFTRAKHQGGIPTNAFRACLDHADLGIRDIDVLAVGLDPTALQERRAAFGIGQDVTISDETIRASLGVEAPIVFVPHHRAHAASAFYFSPFEEAAVLVVDGVGEWETTSVMVGRGHELTEIDSLAFPHSLGLFYAAITQWLGFRVNHDEYKVMGLSSWGDATRQAELSELVASDGQGFFQVDLDCLSFLDGPGMFSDAFCDLVGPARSPDEPLQRHHVDVAASAQAVLEARLLELAAHARELTGCHSVCTAGGVMLNAVANGALARSGLFTDVWFQPVAGDAGTALGAAAMAAIDLGCPRPAPLADLRIGPATASAGADMLTAAGISYHDYSADDGGLVEAVAELLARGAIVGWYHGRMEFGPRALGARSILADARSTSSRDRINAIIKDREPWRPLAPIVHASAAEDLFSCDHELPFMIETVPVQPHAALPAVTHVDGTARPQTVRAAVAPRLSDLLEAVDRHLGVPVLVNTSFNHASEPIVASPADALVSAIRCGLDALVVEDILVPALPPADLDLLEPWLTPVATSTENLYPL